MPSNNVIHEKPVFRLFWRRISLRTTPLLPVVEMEGFEPSSFKLYQYACYRFVTLFILLLRKKEQGRKASTNPITWIIFTVATFCF